MELKAVDQWRVAVNNLKSYDKINYSGMHGSGEVDRRDLILIHLQIFV